MCGKGTPSTDQKDRVAVGRISQLKTNRRSLSNLIAIVITVIKFPASKGSLEQTMYNKAKEIRLQNIRRERDDGEIVTSYLLSLAVLVDANMRQQLLLKDVLGILDALLLGGTRLAVSTSSNQIKRKLPRR